MVGKRHIGFAARDHVPHRIDIGLHVAIDLRVAALGERPRLDLLVAIGHIHRKQPADVGAIDGRAGVSHLVHHELAPVPVAHGGDELELFGVALLTEEIDLVPEAHERGGEARVVDVGACPPQQVAVKDEHTHGGEVIRAAGFAA